MRITFSQLPGLQYITHKRDRFEAVYTGAGRLPDVYRAGTNERAQLPAAVLAELVRRFEEAHKNEFYLMEAKSCTI